MAINRNFWKGIILLGVITFCNNAYCEGNYLPGPLEELYSDNSFVSDTIPPLREREGNFITDETYNPFDIFPNNIEQTVEYDMDTDTYIIIEKIGDEYYRSPTYLSFDEYMEWRAKKQEREYFDKISGVSTEYKSGTGKIDPLSRINLDQNLTDRLFGGNEITIEPQGGIDLIFGLDYQRNENPNLDPRQQTQGPFLDFDMDIKMNVEGKIGDKMDLGFNYDTNASFDFDRKIKLAYDSEQWTEDDIIKKIEAGNVSLPLRGNLIQGAQSLFGLKTELLFGNLRITGIASQQKSKQETVAIQNGSSTQEFEIRPQEYDEFRHFFISHYHRDNFEEALSGLPNIKSNFRVSNLEVWVSDDNGRYQQNQTMVCALSDMGEPDIDRFNNPNSLYGLPNVIDPNNIDRNGDHLPVNEANTLFETVTNDMSLTTSDGATRELGKETNYNLRNGVDYAVFRGRKLSPSEYTFNEELGFISLNLKLQDNQNLAIAYEYFYTLNCEGIYKVGVTTDEGARSNTDSTGTLIPETVIFTKLLRGQKNSISDPSWDLMMKNVYPLRTSGLDPENFEFDIFYENDRDGSLRKVLSLDLAESLGADISAIDASVINRVRRTPLLNLFGLDKLNSRLDPQPDGVFDFVPGVTVITQSSSIVFPVLEPFGESLDSLLGSEELAQYYAFPELYDTSLVIAEQSGIVKNKFVMVGKSESSVASEYSLGAWNIPQGSVRVTAGSRQLVEGADYEVDYSIGRVRILNESLLQQGIPINISFEDNSVFSLQQKTMLGLRAEYEVNENFYLGATYLRLFERPFTQKVNIYDDPINNRVLGFDMDFSTESMWITNVLDKLPFYETNTPSNVNFSAEVAALKPGHSRAINSADEKGGIIHIDDFEGAVTGFPLSSQANNVWSLASVPRYDSINLDRLQDFPEGRLDSSLISGMNRAKLAWYVFDQSIVLSSDNSNSYVRYVDQEDLFDRQVPQGILGNLQTFDLTYFPDERGPYNFDPPNGVEIPQSGQSTAGSRFDEQRNMVVLNEPETRWAGIMRYLPNNDFQSANYEFIEFWMLNPFLEKPDGQRHGLDEEGYLTIHLGNVSEDILNDGGQFYENSLRNDESSDEILKNTVWGKVPILTPNNNGFNREDQVTQDLGLDGLTDGEETEKFADYLNAFQGQPNALWSDPAGDNFVSFNNLEENEGGYSEDDDPLRRYSKFNNPQGNSPNFNASNQVNPTNPALQNQRINRRGQPQPDQEDFNNNRTLDSDESFFEYRIKLANDAGEIDERNNPYIRDIRTISNERAGNEEKWYRFRIPLEDGIPINKITDFRSIQFMRILVNGFETQKTFRLAELELIRSQWRRKAEVCDRPVDGTGKLVDFTLDAVGFEENNSKLPFNYVLPKGIQRERLFNTFSNVLQDERSLALKYCDFPSSCYDVSAVKLNNLDFRQYENFQMFVHAEESDGIQEDGDMAVFIRMGKDDSLHYYEYEIPLTLSDTSKLGVGGFDKIDIIWPEANKFDFPLDYFIQAKKLRNVSEAEVLDRFTINKNRIRDLNLSTLASTYSSIDLSQLDSLPEGHSLTIKGNPNLGKIKILQIGIRRKDKEKDNFCGEVWVNEMRLTGLKERIGYAGMARLDVQLADLGSITAAGSYSSIGWGALDDRIHDRSLEAITEYDFSTSLELGNFFPSNWGLRVPFYAQYGKSIRNPEFDAFDFDIKVEDEFDLNSQGVGPTDEEIKDRNPTVTTIKTFNLTNVRKERVTKTNTNKSLPPPSNKGDINKAVVKPKEAKKQKKPMPWDIENFSASYAFTEMEYRDPIVEYERTKDYKLGVDYIFSRRGGYIEPFKKIKSKHLKIIKEINFNPLPNSFTFSSTINRYKSERKFRLPKEIPLVFNDQRYTWDRTYDVGWNLTKALKVNFSAFNESYIDELRQVGIADTPDERDLVDQFGRKSNAAGQSYSDLAQQDANFLDNYRRENLRGLGRNTNYDHQLSINYNLPIKLLPYMDWVDVKAQYRSSYNWSAGPLVTIDDDGTLLGAIIQNSQNRSLTANFNLEKLYNKSKYIKGLDRIGTSRTKRTRNSLGKEDETKVDKAQTKPARKKKAKEPSKMAKLLLRPLFMVRSIRFNYKEDFRTIVPGFTETPRYFGLSRGFEAPGTGFVLGLQPDLAFGNRDNWLYQAAEKDWISKSTALNQQVVQIKNQNLEAKIKIEPWRDFKIDIDFKKNYSFNHQEEFKTKTQGENDFQQLAARDVGSFELTYFSTQTLFGYNSEDELQALFQTFESYRSIISNRLANDPDNGTHSQDGSQYAYGYGKLSSQVIIPAFLAAYTNKDPETISTDLEADVSSLSYIPRPNWSLRYDGLSKLPWFKEKFSSVSIKHGYSNILRVNSFMNDVQYDRTNPFAETKLNGNYYSRIEIPAIQISEQFRPVIGVSIKTRSDLTLDFEYNKTRNLDLSINTAKELNEQRTTEFVFGFGYTIKNSSFLKKKKRKRRRSRATNPDDQNNTANNTGRRQRGNVTTTRGSDITISLDFGIADDISYVHDLDFNADPEQTRGAKTIFFSPACEYMVNDNLKVTAFFDYNSTEPYLNTAFKTTTIQGGIRMGIILN